MPDFTTNYNLEKATENEYYEVALHGRNMDKIDAALKANADAIATKETPAGAQAKADAAEGNAKNFASSLIGTLSSLLTTAKNNIVAAINEIKNSLDAHQADTRTQNVHGIQELLKAVNYQDSTPANYTYNNLRIQCGQCVITTDANGNGTKTITWPVSLTQHLITLVSHDSGAGGYANPSNPTSTGCDIVVRATVANSTRRVFWAVIGRD
jgi:hypothetical protein